jgi:hypothetical protein
MPDHLLRKLGRDTSLLRLGQIVDGCATAPSIPNFPALICGPIRHPTPTSPPSMPASASLDSIPSEPSMSVSSTTIKPMPTAEQIRALSEKMWSRRACWFQAEIVEHLLRFPKRNLVATAATGTGKSYTFFLPALYEQSGVTFIIVPLKKLAHQHCESAIKLGLSAMTLEAETISKEVINVRFSYSTHADRLISMQEIAEIKYQYVILGPDLLTSELVDPRVPYVHSDVSHSLFP